MSNENTHAYDLQISFDELLSDPRVAEAVEDADLREDLIDDLIALRKAAKLRQKDVAEHMDCTQSTVSDFENGAADPYFSTLQRYARAVGHKLNVRVEKAESGIKSNYAKPMINVESADAKRIEVAAMLGKGFVESYAAHESRRSDFATAA